MNKFTTLLIVICQFTLYGQNTTYLNYKVLPTSYNSNEIRVTYEMQLPELKETDTKMISGIIDFSLQIINKKEANNPEIKGEEIAFFIESINLKDTPNKTSSFTLPNNVSFSKTLPENMVYRLIHKYDSLLLLNPDDSSYEKRIPINAQNNILLIDSSVKKPNLNITIVNKPTSVTRGMNYMLETDIINQNTASCLLPNIKLEVHLVNQENVLTANNTQNQRLISNSGLSTTVQSGISKYFFNLKVPEIPSDFLPEGKTYRVRLINDSISGCKTNLPPFELKVTKNNFEKKIYSENNEVSIFPSPVKDYLIVKTKKKSKNYKIYDISGELVKEQMVLRRISVSDLKPGIYLIETDYGVTRFTKE